MLYRKFAITVCACLASLTLAARPAQAAVRHIRHPLRYFAYDYAAGQRGKWYCWGGTGPSCYDCSGLVWAAYRRVHILLPRTTYEMLTSKMLIRISKRQSRRGDLAFYGDGHVEIVAAANITLGAHAPGQRIGFTFDNAAWHPTAYYRIRGAG
jgi:cell wall-associated NlpC family hydrolase